MMKDRFRQISVIATVFATILINILANALPFNGLNTGQISDRFQVYFVPAGYVFSIWGIIYIGLIAFAVYQALPSQRQNPRLRNSGWWIVLSGFANMAWIFLWHYEKFLFTVPVMLTLLVTLIIVYIQTHTKDEVSLGEKIALRLPFSIYLGWITVATIANISDVLYYYKWDGFGLSPLTWMIIMLIATLVITALVLFTRRDIAFSLVILWALAGITVKQANETIIVTSTWLVFGGVIITLALAYLLPIGQKNGKESVM
jgi:benzodiazapine receptor